MTFLSGSRKEEKKHFFLSKLSASLLLFTSYFVSFLEKVKLSIWRQNSVKYLEISFYLFFLLKIED